MLPKNNRLTSRFDYAKLKKTGRKYQSLSFALLYQENNHLPCRFGVIVSTRISRKATQRNKIKRQLREVLFKLIPRLLPGFDFLFLTKTNIVGKSVPEIEKEVFDLFNRLKLLK